MMDNDDIPEGTLCVNDEDEYLYLYDGEKWHCTGVKVDDYVSGSMGGIKRVPIDTK